MILDINLYNHRQAHSQIHLIDFIRHLQTFAAHNHQHIEGEEMPWILVELCHTKTHGKKALYYMVFIPSCRLRYWVLHL